MHNTILVSSSGPFQSIVRCRNDDSCGFRREKKQACLVLLKLRPPAQRPFSKIDLKVGRAAARLACVFLPIQLYLFQREQVWIDCNSMTVALQCTSVQIVPFWSSHCSALGVGGTTACVNPIFFVPNLSLLSIFQECQNMCRSYCSVSFMTTFVS